MIWRDRWLPDKENSKIESIPYPYLENAVVSSLLTTQGTEWDEEIITEIFNQRYAKLILSISIPKTKNEDILIWALEERGNFTVKSCYKALTYDHSNSPEWLLQKLRFLYGKCALIVSQLLINSCKGR